jgi:hypothetical protein
MGGRTSPAMTIFVANHCPGGPAKASKTDNLSFLAKSARVPETRMEGAWQTSTLMS